MISAAQVSEATVTAAGAQDRATIIAALSREDVQSALVARGIDVKEAESRVAALSDEEASSMAAHIDSAPAGGIIGAIVLIFLVLLLTDILGFTKVFPFTRSLK